MGHRHVLECTGQEGDDLVAVPEPGDVVERQVHGVRDPTGAAQSVELVELSLSAGHASTMRRRC